MRRFALLVVLGLSAFVSKIPGVTPPPPTAVFRASDQTVWITSLTSSTPTSAGAAFPGDPGATQNPSGDTYVADVDSSHAMWVNTFPFGTQAWSGWASAGGTFATGAVASISANAAGAVIVARDASGAIWWTTFAPPATFGIWQNLGGQFPSTDPIVAVVPGSSPISFYVVCRDSSTAIWSGYWNGTAFGGWQHGGARAISSRISMTVGSDGNAYVGIIDPSDAIWMAQVQQNTFGTWYSGGGSFSLFPAVAVSNGQIYLCAGDFSSGIWTATFAQGSSNGWAAWTILGGRLSYPQIAALSPKFAVAGNDGSGGLWWYNANTATWSRTSAPQADSAGIVAVSPR
jgi:hypothetical protein